MAKNWLISSDCHAGGLSGTANDSLPKESHHSANGWWIEYASEVMIRRGALFEQETSESNSRWVGGSLRPGRQTDLRVFLLSNCASQPQPMSDDSPDPPGALDDIRVIERAGSACSLLRTADG